MKSFFQVAGNEPTVRVTCKDQSLAAIDLTSGSAVIRWRVSGSTPVSSATMTLDDASAGKVSYKFQAGELVAGTMLAEVVITDAAGSKFSSREEFIIEVRRAA